MKKIHHILYRIWYDTLSTGWIIRRIPSTFYHPLTVKQRIRILHEIAQCCQKGAYRILKKPLNHLSENLRMALCGNTCSLTYQTNAGEHMCFAITEPFILQIFQDFLTNMDPDVLLHTGRICCDH